MQESKFIKKYSATWEKLESLSSIINKKGVKSLSSKQVKDFLNIFKQCSHHLAYTRTHYPNSNIVSYLNNLVSKGHSHVYTVKKSSFRNFKNYIFSGFPELLKKNRIYLLGSLGFFTLGIIISFLFVLYKPEQAYLFLPGDLVESIKANKLGGGEWNYPLMSSYIMINNITVALRAFVLGITLGLGTIYVLFFNGTMLGALTALVYLYADPIKYWSLILPHGIIELSAIFISGAAGLIIAKSILLPGKYSRKHALIAASKQAVSLVIGVVFMLIIAGIIEGFFTPLDISNHLKLLFAAITAIILSIYCSIPYFNKQD
ncbi:stage II sporulation protein M [Iocasia frigidifontis]|uniref:Stage II sporulation protein M n=1 Tax=Iocasia fonsfrigidae TaxID=2682810 RepID=A0A8A7KJM0_9FIRM|nr:stage II sporulation protein M [Iocasia fonsfrigidae]QTL98314.1 stage II sporulation protein M [Iocasia fonsfrigidae]